MKPGKKGIARVIDAATYSMRGLKSCLKNEAAFRQEVALFLIALPILIFMPVPLWLKLLVATGNLLVLIVELLNSALEAIVDMVSPEYHELAGRAKDQASAAVFLALLVAGMFWCYAIYYAFFWGRQLFV